MPISRSKKSGRDSSDKENSSNEESKMVTKPSFNLPHLTMYSGTLNEDSDRFFMLF